jgi:uncharacterized protein YoxC
MMRLYLILLLVMGCSMTGCGTISNASEASENAKEAAAVVATRVQQADEKIELLTQKYDAIKESVTEKVETVTNAVTKVTDKVDAVKDTVAEKVEKVREEVKEEIDEFKEEARVKREEFEEDNGPIDKDGDGDVSIKEILQTIKENPERKGDWEFWKMLLYAFLGISGAAGAKKGADMYGRKVVEKHGSVVAERHAEDIYQSGRQKRLSETEGPDG